MNLETFKKINKKNMPDKPGVYFFRKGSKILYIGKATSLRTRTQSYFRNDLIETRGPGILDMVVKTDNIKWQETDSVLEALILEANLIKKHQPYYNVREKDDKSWNYVVITREKLPRVMFVRGKELQQKYKNYDRFTRQNPTGSDTTRNFHISASNTFGPYTSGGQLKEAMKIIRPIFPYLDEKIKNYYTFYKQVNLAPDVTTPEGIKKYKNNIKNLKLFFEGKKKQVVKNLRKEMFALAKNKEFEKAGEVKKQIFALGHINDVALLKLEPSTYNLETNFRIEAYDIAHMSGKNMVGVMTVVASGTLAKNEYKKFKIKTVTGANDTEALAEVLKRRLNHVEWQYPHLIVVDGGIAQLNMAKAVLREVGLDIALVSVVKDDRHKARAILGQESLATKHKFAILLANTEAHRFAIAYHKKMRSKNFLSTSPKPSPKGRAPSPSEKAGDEVNL